MHACGLGWPPFETSCRSLILPAVPLSTTKNLGHVIDTVASCLLICLFFEITWVNFVEIKAEAGGSLYLTPFIHYLDGKHNKGKKWITVKTEKRTYLYFVSISHKRFELQILFSYFADRRSSGNSRNSSKSLDNESICKSPPLLSPIKLLRDSPLKGEMLDLRGGNSSGFQHCRCCRNNNSTSLFFLPSSGCWLFDWNCRVEPVISWRERVRLFFQQFPSVESAKRTFSFSPLLFFWIFSIRLYSECISNLSSWRNHALAADVNK